MYIITNKCVIYQIRKNRTLQMYRFYHITDGGKYFTHFNFADSYENAADKYLAPGYWRKIDPRTVHKIQQLSEQFKEQPNV